MVEAREDVIEHVVCGHCEPEVYLCGTARLADDEEMVVPIGTPHAGLACAVCHAAEHLTCQSCGAKVRTRPRWETNERSAAPFLIRWFLFWLIAVVGLVIWGVLAW